jgi:uncharacterized protein YydD (DUF2326 family)
LLQDLGELLAQSQRRVDELQEKNSSLRVDLAKSSNQLQVLDERYRNLVQQNDAHIQEITMLRMRNQETAEAKTRHEQKEAEALAKLRSEGEKVRQLESEVLSLKERVTHHQGQEVRLVTENARLDAEATRMRRLLETHQVFFCRVSLPAASRSSLRCGRRFERAASAPAPWSREHAFGRLQRWRRPGAKFERSSRWHKS